MGKYDQYIITTPRPLEYTHFRLPPDVRRSVTWADSTVVDGMCNMECIWYYKPLSGPPHHVETDTDEILAFIGTNHEDPEDLGGIIRFRFEDEWVTLTKSCMIYLPKPEYTYTGLTKDKVTVNGKEASVFENPSTQSGGDMRVFHELDVLKVVKKVKRIEITTPPAKTEYMAGENFEPAGMVVTAVYEDDSTAVLPETGYTIFHGENLQRERTYVTIQYDDGSASSDVKINLPITVNPYEGDHKHTYGNLWYSDDTSHWHQCTAEKCPALSDSTKDLASHTFVWKVEKAATATETGSKYEKCTVCSYKRSENTVIPKLSGSGTATPGTTIPGMTGGTTGAAKSPKTGDAGIALYAGLSLLALSGSGWVVGKKRRGEK